MARIRKSDPIAYLLYFPKPLDSTHPRYLIHERIQNIRHALGCSYLQLSWMLGASRGDIVTFSHPRAGFPSYNFVRRLHRVELVFAEELRYYLQSPRTRDKYHARFEIRPIWQAEGGYKLRCIRKFSFYPRFWLKYHQLCTIAKVEDVAALRQLKRTRWEKNTFAERRRNRLYNIAVREAASGGFTEVVECRSEYGADYDSQPG